MRFFSPRSVFTHKLSMRLWLKRDDKRGWLAHIFVVTKPSAWQKLFWEMQSNKAEKDEKFGKITSKHDLIEHRWRMEVLIFNFVIVCIFFLHYIIKRRNEAQLHKNLEFHRVEYLTWQCFSISKDLSTNWMYNSGYDSSVQTRGDLYLCLYYHF